MTGCGAPTQTLAGPVNAGAGSVIQGTVLRTGAPAAGAYVRLLDEGGEFTAEVVSSAAGEFRFFAAPGRWLLRVLVPGGAGSVAVRADAGEVVEVTVPVSS